MSLQSELDLIIAQEIVEMKEILNTKVTEAFEAQKSYTESRVAQQAAQGQAPASPQTEGQVPW